MFSDELPDPGGLTRLAERWTLRHLELAGRGLEFTVYRAVDADGAPVVLRLAGRRFDANANDPAIDTRGLLTQEYEITRHLHALGFPVAEPLRLHISQDDTAPDVLLARYVPDDSSAVDGHLLGTLLARLHQLPPPVLTPVAAEGVSTPAVLVARILRRWAEVGRLVSGWPAPPSVHLLCAPLTRIGTAGLVHLDVRADNIRRAGGQVGALLDWSNTLLGDPTLEFGRVTEYARYPENELDLPAIRAGYARTGQLPADDTGASQVCRLDAALMLALVFLSEAPDPLRGPAAADHVRYLAEQLAAR